MASFASLSSFVRRTNFQTNQNDHSSHSIKVYRFLLLIFLLNWHCLYY